MDSLDTNLAKVTNLDSIMRWAFRGVPIQIGLPRTTRRDLGLHMKPLQMVKISIKDKKWVFEFQEMNSILPWPGLEFL